MDEIIQVGVIRSGSVYMFQVIKDLFPCFDIKKVHEFFGGKCPVVGSYRDPRDCLISAWRVRLLQVQYEQTEGDENANVDNSVEALEPDMIPGPGAIDWYGKEVMRCFRVLERYEQSTHPFRMFKYEEFHVNDNILFDGLEEFFNIQIDNERRALIRDKYSMDSNRKRASMMKGFGEYSPNHKIHGKHVFKGAINGWKEYVPDELHGKMNFLFHDVLKKYGYA